MSTQTCISCGTDAPLNASFCPNCGSRIATPEVHKWTSIKDRLPDRLPTNPDRSINVLICEGIEDGSKDDYGRSESDYGGNSLVSAYYNFKTGLWENDFYKDRIFYEKAPNLRVTHWLPLPPYSYVGWKSVHEAMPEMLDSFEGISVLTCKKGHYYESSIIKANFLTMGEENDGVWQAYLDFDSKADDRGTVEITHWCEIPDGPSE